MPKPKTTKPASAARPSKSAPKTQAKAEKKADKLIALLKREGGAALSEVTETTGWLPHSARAMLTGLRKKGFTLDKTKVEGVTRYAIKGAPAA